MKRTRMVLWAALFVVLGCSHTPVENKVTAVRDTRPQVELLFTPSRHLELEPCGCSLAKQGGLAREANYLQKLKAEAPGNEIFSFTAGTTFVPVEESFNIKQKDLYAKKAEFLVEAMATLQMKALSPSANDFFLGLKTLRDLEAKSTFPWVSANLVDKATGKPVFKPYVEIFSRAGSFIVTGVSANPVKPYGNAKEIVVKDPTASLKAILKDLPPTPRLVVVLSSLDAAGRLKLHAELPEVNLLFGGAENDASYMAEQYTGRFMHVNPANRGRAIARLTLQGNSFGSPLYNKQVSEGFARSRNWWTLSIQDTTEALRTGTLKGTEKKAALATKSRFERFLKQTESIPMTEQPDALKFESAFTILDEKFDNPKNELSALVERYREAVRELALDADN